jgi:starch synthase
VASIPKRIQVYFIDNDEYFKEATFADEEGVMYPDNDERAIFFAKELRNGKKIELGSIIHVHGWMAAMLLYMKHFIK